MGDLGDENKMGNAGYACFFPLPNTLIDSCPKSSEGQLFCGR